jgi:hypothetical protein
MVAITIPRLTVPGGKPAAATAPADSIEPSDEVAAP